jgi:AcrR family transcriptional regulator
MSKKKEAGAVDGTTQERIKNAAREMFHKKGYAATRTRDIAKEAGINIALLNYYFRSKEKLFEIIMFQTLFEFMQTMSIIFNDESTTLERKIEICVSQYIDKITKEPDIPNFVLNELRNRSHDFLEKIRIKQLLLDSSFLQQYQEAVAKGKIAEPKPLHFLLNLMGLIVFPFIGMPIMENIFGIKNTQFNQIIQERKKLIPHWVQAMFFKETESR